MCGILGVYFNDELRKVDIPGIKGACEIIRHRGPDDEGYVCDGNIGLGVRRLSVIDLSAGHQPIHNEDKTFWVILNGEIYNYRELKEELINKGHIFYTDSDTEVIVHLYEDAKEECVHKLNGMFSLAVLDARNKTLFVARDRLGIKPLYYYDEKGIFVFASELKLIRKFLGAAGRIDCGSLNNFFSLNYIPAPNTIFQDTKQLLPGHYMVAGKEGIRISRYWEGFFDKDKNITETQAIDKLQYLLKKSVMRMLRSDVALGAFLSGGMDSTTLVSLMSESYGSPLKTFSVGFSEDSYDETSYAELAAGYFKTQHYKISCGPDDVIQNLPKIVWHADNLLSDPSMLPLYLVSRLARQHVTVCLSGDGGDEMFMGYPTYLADTYLEFYKKIPWPLRRFLIEMLVGAMPVSNEKLSFEYKAKKFIEATGFLPGKAHYWWRTVFTDKEKSSLFSEDFKKEIQVDSYSSTYMRYYKKDADSPFDNYLFADMKVWLADNNLIRVDTMSMAHSLEVRVPFLDHELVEFMMKIPPELKMKGGKLKYLLKKAYQDKLPSRIVRRSKSGWHVPLGKWFRQELKEYVQDTLSSSRALNTGMFNKGYIDNLLQEHFRGQRNNVYKIWGLLVFCKWFDAYC